MMRSINSIPGISAGSKIRRFNSKILYAVVAVGVFATLALSSGMNLFPSQAAATDMSLNNVQIEVQTTNSSLTSYYLTVYNSTGYPVISSSSQYGEFGAMLPSGTYLFVVTATLQYPYCCPITYATGSGTASAGAPTSSVTNGSSTGSSVIYPITYPQIEYGYAMKEITGAVSFTIQTSSMSNVPTSDIKVHVSYANGTAASGAYVSASIIGSYYYFPTSNWIMYGQTASDGTFTLKVPTLPLEVYAYSSIYVNVPKNLTTYTTTIGGEKVNVTVYWQPMYVYFEGYDLVLPPDTTSNITLHAQQQNYYVTPYAKGETTPLVQSVKTTTVVTSGAIGQYQPSGPTNQPQIIPPFSLGTTTQSASGTPFGTSSEQLLLGVTLVAVAIAAFSLAFALRRRPANETKRS